MEKCKLCGRPLKSERSKLLGYGPSCFKKAGFIIKKGKVVKRLDKWK